MSRGTLDPARQLWLSDTGLSPSLAGCSKAVLLSVTESLLQSEPRDARITVWPLPRSLAATYGIDVSFSSSGYLDVSVPRVPFHKLWIHLWMTVDITIQPGFPIRNLRIKGYLLLPEAYRSLSRLSSALSAKASALRPSSLDLSVCNFSRYIPALSAQVESTNSRTRDLLLARQALSQLS